MTRIEWISCIEPTGIQIRQVYAFIFDGSGRILIQDDGGRRNLPGGKPEGNETALETLRREVLEESQVLVGRSAYLGFQRVEQRGEVFAQLRFAALLRHVLPIESDVATGRSYGRLWVPPFMVNNMLGWGSSGDRQVHCAVVAAAKLGCRWTGAELVEEQVMS